MPCLAKVASGPVVSVDIARNTGRLGNIPVIHFREHGEDVVSPMPAKGQVWWCESPATAPTSLSWG